MLTCPRCRRGLVADRRKAGITWSCADCGGRALALQVLRRRAPDGFVPALWSQARHPDAKPGVACPSCLRRSREAWAQGEFGPVTLDVCTACQVAWLDRAEWDGVPERPPEPPRRPLSAEAAVVAASFQLEHAKVMEAHREASPRGGLGAPPPPQEVWKWLPALFGLPVELGGHRLARRAVVTWSLLPLIAAVSILAFRDIAEIAQAWGFRPADPWRRGGLTFLTSFFLHVDWLHLLGNLYFLWVIGDDVESLLGHGRYLVLLLAATVVGDLAYAAVATPAARVAIGSSGGISGALAFYALALPRVRIGLLFFYVVWLRVPVWAYVLFWVALQAIGASTGAAGVAYTAHLGGALAGLLAWALWRRGLRVRPQKSFGTSSEA